MQGWREKRYSQVPPSYRDDELELLELEYDKKLTLVLHRAAPGSRRRGSRNRLLRAASRMRRGWRLLRLRRAASTWGKLGKHRLRREARLEPVDRDVVGPGPNLKQEGLLRALDWSTR